MEENQIKIYNTKLKKALSNEEQNHYLRLLKNGDEEAKNILFEHNLRLVGHVVQKHFKSSSIDKEDLMQIGSVGLLKAINNFDVDLGYEFSTYAIPMIIGEIRRYNRDNQSILHIPRRVQNILFKIAELKNNYEGDKEDLTPTKLSEMLEIPEDEIIEAIQSRYEVSSLQQTIYTDKKSNNESTLEDSLEDINFSVDSLVDQIDIKQAIEKLSEREQIIIKGLFSIGCKTKTQMELAQEIGKSQAHVSRIQRQALKKLKNILSDDGLNVVDKNKLDENNVNMNYDLTLLLKEYPGHTKEELLGAINTLSDRTIKILELKYGLTGNKPLKNVEIAKKLGLSASNISGSINYIKKKIEEQVNKNEKNKEVNEDDVNMNYDLTLLLKEYPGHTEEELLGAINTLSDRNVKILELKYGLTGNKPLKNREVDEKLCLATNSTNSRLSVIKKDIAQKIGFDKNKNEENNEYQDMKKQELLSYYPGETEENVLNAINSLNDENKLIMELKYGLNGNTPKNNQFIADKVGIKVSTLTVRIVNIRKSIEKNLNKNRVNNVQEETKKEVEIIDFEEKETNSNEIDDFLTKIKEIEQEILENNFNLKFKNCSIGNTVIKVKTAETIGLFAYRENRFNQLDRAHSLKKKCNVYSINAYDSNNKLLYENVLVKEIKTGKFYKYIRRYEDGMYKLDKINNDELVCYDIGKENISLLESPKKVEEKKFDTPVKVIKKDKSEELLKDGIDLFNAREIVHAEQSFIKALSSDKKYVLQKANYYMGKIYLAKKKAIIAENYLKDSLKIENNNYDTLIELAKSLVMQQKYDEAIDIYNKCNICSPNGTRHQIEKAKCYIKKGDTDSAFGIFNFLIRRNPNNYYAHLEKGTLLFELNKLTEAKKEYEICDKLSNKGLPKHKINLGKIEYLEGNIGRAESLFDEMINYDIEKNTMYNISNIGYFFHKLGNKDLSYKYYLKAPIFQRWVNIPEWKVEEHIKQHTSNSDNEKMHSIFNFPVSMELLNNLIKDIEKTSTKELYDVYQIHCENAGYMIIDGDNRKQEDYITILTLPFSKKIMNSYPDNKIDNSEIKKSVTLEELIQNNSKVANTDEVEVLDLTEKENNENDNELFKYFDGYSKNEILEEVNELSDDNKEIMELRYGLNGNSPMAYTKVAKKLGIKPSTLNVRIISIRKSMLRKLEKKKNINNKNNNIIVESKSGKIVEDNTVTNEEVMVDETPIVEEIVEEKPQTKETVKDEDVTLITDKNEQKTSDIMNYESQMKLIVNSINDTTKRVVLLLNLGCVRNNCYSEEEISSFLGIEKSEVSGIIVEFREQLKQLINLIPDTTEQVTLLLKLGYIRNQYFTNKQLSEFYNTSEIEVENIINNGLTNMIEILKQGRSNQEKFTNCHLLKTKAID